MVVLFHAPERPPATRRPARIRFRFGLRTLLIVTTVLCLTLGLLLREAIDYQRRKDGARELISSLNGQVKDIGWSLEPSDGDNWLSRMFLRTEHHEQLWSVDLTGTSVSGPDLATLSRCDWIRKLNLSNTTTGDAELAHVARLTKLRELTLDNTIVSDRGVPQLYTLERLVYLRALTPGVTYAGLAELDRLLPGRRFKEQQASLKVIPEIAVSGPVTLSNEFRRDDEMGMRGLMAPNGIVRMSIHGNSVTASALNHAKHLTSARSLSVNYGAKRFNDVDAFACWPELRDVAIYGGQLTDEDVKHFATLSKLKYLTLVGAHQFTDAAIAQLGENHTLERLELHNLKITAGIAAQLGGLKRLRTLSLYAWQKDTRGLHGLLSSEQTAKARSALEQLRELPRLESVRLHGNVFSDEVVRVLADFKRLKQIGYDYRFVSEEMVDSLRVSLPGCEIKSEGFTDDVNLD